MWRCAYGRLAAIVVLAGGLSTCATAPKPVEENGDDHRGRMICGGAHPPLSRDEFAARIGKEVRQSCGPSAVSGSRYGEIRIILRHPKGGETSFETEGGGELSDDDRRCVVDAASRALPANPRGRYDDDYYSIVQDSPVTVVLGMLPPAASE
jgi:hypothetical protein